MKKYFFILLSLVMSLTAGAQPTTVAYLQTDKIQPADETIYSGGSGFAHRIDVSGTTVVASANTGRDLLQVGGNVGAVYIYEFDGQNLQLTDMLEANDREFGDAFGTRVSIDNDKLLVTSPRSIEFSNAGSAYIFEKLNNQWLQTTKLVPSDSQAGDFFGFAAKIVGDWAFIGAPFTDESELNSGSVYVYKKTNNTWTQVQELHSSVVSAYYYFGYKIAYDNNRLFVGNIYSATQAVHVFELSNDSWLETGVISAADNSSSDRFGFDIYPQGDTVVISAIGVTEQGFNNAGAVYVFNYDANNTVWQQQAKIFSPTPNESDYFGRGLFLDSRFLYVGTPFYDSSATNDGLVTIFHENNGSWNFLKVLTDINGSSDDGFGVAINKIGEQLLVSSAGDVTGSLMLFSNDVIFAHGFE